METKHKPTSKIIQDRVQCWDGSASMRVIYNDGGRAKSGWKGNAGDCVVRAIAIATDQPYQDVYDALFALNKNFAENSRSRAAVCVKKSGGTPRNGNFKNT